MINIITVKTVMILIMIPIVISKSELALFICLWCSWYSRCRTHNVMIDCHLICATISRLNYILYHYHYNYHLHSLIWLSIWACLFCVASLCAKTTDNKPWHNMLYLLGSELHPCDTLQKISNANYTLYTI